MDNKAILSGCAACGISRRGFLAAGCAACVGAMSQITVPRRALAAQTDRKPLIKVIYALHAEKQPGPDWPNVGFDFKPVMDRVNAALAQACPEFDFVTAMANGEDQAKEILKNDRKENIDGYLVYQMNCWNRVAQAVAATGKPVLYADFQFGGSGGFLVYTAEFIRKNTPNLGFVASSRIEDLIAAVKCFDAVIKKDSPAAFAAAVAQTRLSGTPKSGDLACTPDDCKILSIDEWLARLKTAKILAVQSKESGKLDSILGMEVIKVPFAEVNAEWSSADKDEARAVADRWQKNASAVVDVSRETLETSAAMYLAQKAVMKKYGANAITINCLGGFYGGDIHAYPCLGFHELSNEGLIGACECDVRSTATMVAFTTLTQGRPGYISDPIIDTSKRQIVYAHCVASNKAFGPDGPANPFQILTHSEDRQGASVRSVLPTGYLTTTLELSQERKEILFHQSKAVANDPDDRACRTKLCAEPIGDIEKLFTMWDHWGWHRVTYYGDLKAPVYALADAVGWKVVEEA